LRGPRPVRVRGHPEDVYVAAADLQDVDKVFGTHRFQNSATAIDLGFYVARSYSLMKPPRTCRRLIRSWKRSATGSRAGAGARWTPRSRLASPAHAAVVELAAAWRDPAAWEGMTEAGGLRMPADVMGAVALDQLVLHGWDLAGATGQSFTCDPASTAAVLAFTGASARPPGTGCSGRWPMTRECADVRPGARISQPRPAWDA
jgi:hypothetical protein